MRPTLTLNKKIPVHLLRYVTKQEYGQYSPVDQAVWRYVMRQNFHFLKGRAHDTYKSGLKKSGILIDRIPRMGEMNECLQSAGWEAVPVRGLIPASAFFGLLAHGFLPVPTGIRTLERIPYTPVHDLVHGAAGLAPMLFDEKYARYVRTLAQIGAKALSDAAERELFPVPRLLSAVNGAGEIAEAKTEVAQTISQSKGISEAAQISRLYWWTAECGLIGNPENPKIYGAGLLSSMRERQLCFSEATAKIPFDLETCIQTDYDVTRPQPHLFVCRDFDELIEAVSLFSERMAFRVGGTESLNKAVRSGDIATAEYSTGLQVSGIFNLLLYNEQGEAIYLETFGPTALAYEGEELPGHGKSTHSRGFGSPIGNVKDLPKPLEYFTPRDLHLYHMDRGREVELHFQNGIRIKGVVKDWIFRGNRLILLTLTACTVTYRDHALFLPEWGDYHLAAGGKIVSVFAGSADPASFYADAIPEETEREQTYPAMSTLDHLYQAVQDIRNGKESSTILPTIVRTLDDLYPEDWLLRIEILELCSRLPLFHNHAMKEQTKDHLFRLIQNKPGVKSFILNGLKLVSLP
ncbi:aromatic amino acid hydroxylase [Lihuaxuella thermophila]|uniref:Phenylalanine-4-hydroxylase n=1 Tax=Lihuaxuella thermophila TaxID=1173111 RepID=A0A1H8AF47_9BACL|nr:aromatic amino acid hydroxylase [Lihuaxuella thermophila]SEM69106.1 phenylalanine-4-hydroxylase [Lihuaxuella thermophila]